MNKIYRLIWNHATGQWVVSSELTKSRGKRSKLVAAAVAIALALPAAAAMADEACLTETQAEGTLNAEGICVADTAASGETGFTVAGGIGLMGALDGGTVSGAGAVSVGPSSRATAENATAVGSSANASTPGSVALGHSANTTTGGNAVAVGYYSKAGSAGLAAGARADAATSAVALGAYSTASAERAISIGNSSAASTAGAVAIGSAAKATGGNAASLGNNANSNGNNALSLGSSSAATGLRATAIGAFSVANGTSALAIGTSANAGQQYTIAIGSAASTTGELSIAIGTNASASGQNSVALGADSVADRDNVLSVGWGSGGNGTRQIINVANGNEGFDAVNVNQLQPVIAALGGGASIDAMTGVVTGPTYNVQGTDYNNVGDALEGVDSGLTLIDGRVTTIDGRVTNIDNRVTNIEGGLNDGSIGLVRQDATSRDISVAAGTDGGRIVLSGTAGDRVVSGVAAASADNDAVNLAQLKATGLVDQNGDSLSAVVYDAADKATVSFAGANGTVLNNVADGELTDSSRQAVNGSQLHATNTQVEQNSTDISNVDNRVTNLDGRVTAIDGRVTNIDNRVTNIEGGLSDGSIGLVRQDAISRDISVAAGTDGGRIVLSGTAGDRVVSGVAAASADNDAVNLAQLKATGLVDQNGDSLSAVVYDAADKATVSFAGANGTVLNNVADGELTDSSRQAVNGSQLHATNTQVEQNSTDISNVDNRVTNLDGRVTTIDGRVTNIDNRVTNIEGGLNDGSIGLVRQDATSRDISVAAGTDGGRIVLSGTAGDRVVSGVAAGSADNDAVNLAQLKATGLVDQNGDSLSAVVYDAADKATVSFAGANGTVLNNVADGELTDSSRQAVNGSQLHATNTQVEQNSTDISNVDNRVTNLDGRVTTIDGRVTNIDNRVTNIEGGLNDGSIGLVRQDATSRDISVAAGTDGGRIVLSGTAGDRVVSGVAAASADNDAVNLAQLKATGLVGQNGDSLSAVVYDAADKATVSFAGANGTVLNNVADGELTDSSRQAVNGSQLHATNTQVEQNSTDISNVDNRVTNLDGRVTTIDGRVTNIDNRVTNMEDGFNDGSIGLVRQDAISRDISVAAGTDGGRIVLSGTAGDRVVSGVAAGSADNDAVNLAQLKATGLVGQNGDSLSAVVYDAADKATVSFAGANGTVLNNVADGELTDSSRQAVNGSQLHATNTQVEQNSTDISNVDNRVTNLDGRVTTIDGRVTNIDNRVTNMEDGFNDGSIGLVRQDAISRDISVAAGNDGGRIVLSGTAGDRVVSGVAAGSADNDAVNMGQLKAAGLVAADGSAVNMVAYDSAARDSVTLGGSNATQAVKLKNVADATEDDEAVNLAQLKAAGLVGEAGQTLDAVTYDADSARGQITFAGANGTVLANVGDGRIQSGSRDAVNGGQIAALRDQLQGQIGDLDDRVTSIEKNGAGSGGDNPYFDANGNEASDQSSAAPLPAADAQASGASAVAAGNGANASGNASVAVGASSEAKADNAVALGAGSVADRDNTVSVGHKGGERQITNVAAGVRDTDAVNVSQLNQRLAEAKDYTDQRMDDMWNGVNDRIDHANRQANRGIAGASALVQVTPYLPGKTVLNAGMATYRGESAMGVGISRWSDNGRVNVNAGVSMARGDSAIFRVGVGVVLGD